MGVFLKKVSCNETYAIVGELVGGKRGDRETGRMFRFLGNHRKVDNVKASLMGGL